MRTNPVPPELKLRTLAEGIDHPEGVCWSPFDGNVYAGGEAGQLYRIPLEGGTAEVVTTVPGGFLLGMAFDAAGNLYVCDPSHKCIQRISPDGDVEPYGDEIGYPNYPVFDGEGVLWVSDSGAVDHATGQLYRILPGGKTELVDVRPIMYTNGLAIRDDYLYVVESSMPGVSRLRLAGGELETVIDLPLTTPDGLAFDEEGGLWISCYQPNRIHRLPPEGKLSIILDDWSGEYVFSPTNVAFAGADLDILVLAALGGWWVKAITPGVRGQRLFYPEVAS